MRINANGRSRREPCRNDRPVASPAMESDEKVMTYAEYRMLCAERGVKPLPNHTWQMWCEVLGIST
jgi:hypothetical protein